MAAAVVNTTRQTAAAGRLTRTSSDDPFSSRACQYDAQIHPDGAGAGAGATGWAAPPAGAFSIGDALLALEKAEAALSEVAAIKAALQSGDV